MFFRIAPPPPTYPTTPSGSTFTTALLPHPKREDTPFATQELVYRDLGLEMLEHAFEGYHACIFAYGQTGAGGFRVPSISSRARRFPALRSLFHPSPTGKSYTMMGTHGEEDAGITPRLCRALFERIEKEQSADLYVGRGL